jgi:type IV pilus assembly protein PilE
MIHHKLIGSLGMLVLSDIKFGSVQKGFTLVELMITVVVIGILASIALPNYTDYVRRGKAAEATSTLADLRVRMEQYFQDNRTYLDVSVAILAPCSPAAGTTKYFTYSCTTQTQNTYTISAAPAAGQGMTGFAFSINESNVKTSTYDGTAGATCWLTKKGGTC